MTKLYLPGHIKSELRGDLVSVVTLEGEKYGPFLYRLNEPELADLTGIRAFAHPPVRIYFGIISPVGNEICRRVREIKINDEQGLKDLDKYVIQAHYLEIEVRAERRFEAMFSGDSRCMDQDERFDD